MENIEEKVLELVGKQTGIDPKQIGKIDPSCQLASIQNAYLDQSFLFVRQFLLLALLYLETQVGQFQAYLLSSYYIFRALTFQ